MKYTDFEAIMSEARMSRYLLACGHNSKKAMTLYRLNLKLSQEMFTIISCFEVALRNAIDNHYSAIHGVQWLRDAQRPGGIFQTNRCRVSRGIIANAYNRLAANYTHSKLVAEMDFGFWRYLFAQPQYYAGGQSLINIFPNKPTSTPAIQYNQTHIFQQLKQVNDLRNRIAHHEPICFRLRFPIIDSQYIQTKYNLIIQLFYWMNIDSAGLLYGLDHINNLIHRLDNM